jgi:hypothetical protein
MAELTFKSAGVSTREIDLSGPTAVVPQGIPAGIIGTANSGPAFVPVTFATYQDFVSIFGATDGEKFGPLAVNEWMKYRRAGTYVRVLGIGNAKRRTSSGDNQGKVTNAGFVVGQQNVQTNANGDGAMADSYYARDMSAGTGAGLGRTYFLAVLMSGTSGATYGDTGPRVVGTHFGLGQDTFGDAGIKPGNGANSKQDFVGADAAARANSALNQHTGSMPILRGVLMAPSGVILALSGNPGTTSLAQTASLYAEGNSIAGHDGGQPVGSVNIGSAGNTDFVVLLNGHKHTSLYPNAITASFNPTAKNYISKILNTDATKTEQAGHYLYAHWDVYAAYAVVTGSGMIGGVDYSQDSGPTNTSLWGICGGGVTVNGDNRYEEIALLVTGSGASSLEAVAEAGRNSGASGSPNYESFEDRFRCASSPWFTSQAFGGKVYDLFKIHALDDGEKPTTAIKLSVENIVKSTNDNVEYGTFDLSVRKFDDYDNEPVVLEKFLKLSLNPSDDRYIGRVIGDQHIFYDFDKSTTGQKLVVEGAHPNASRLIRVQVADSVKDGVMDAEALPVGYRGPYHLVTSGSSMLASCTGSAAFAAVTGSLMPRDMAQRIVQPPIPMRRNISLGTSPKQRASTNLYWGIQFEVNNDYDEPNKNDKHDAQLQQYCKYFPKFHTSWTNPWVGDNVGAADVNGAILDSDRFNNNRFTLERVQIKTQSSQDVVDADQWHNAKYRRNGELTPGASGYRFLNVKKDFGSLPSKKYYKFSVFLQGGFDGLNILDEDKYKLTDNAAKREMDDSNQQGSADSTIAAYKKAIDVMAEKADVDIQLLAIPGIRETHITDHAIDQTESRFDAMFIMDIEERDSVNTVVTSSAMKISVTNTTEDFNGRNLDSSFAAAYFPDVVITDPATNTNVRCPPSVGVLGAFGLNDKVAHPWFAPAGFSRGAMKSVLESQVKLNRTNLDTLYEADINPITSFPTAEGVIVFGQKTLLAAQSSLDRVNVRRLLIDIRRKVKAVANTILFEPNREATLARFSASVNPILTTIQQQQGLDRFKVVIDTTTTTQADVENNTVRGKIFLQPTRAVEFIALDFVVSNAGAEI